MSTSQQRFDQLLVEAIDEVLCSLGEPVKNHLYIQLENDFSITKNDLPQQIEEFSHFIFRIFRSGASNIEIKFMQTLYAKISADRHIEHNLSTCKEIDITFLNYVKKMRDSFENSRF